MRRRGLFRKGGDPLSDGLIAHWPLTETSGTTAFDLANGVNGVNSGCELLGVGGYDFPNSGDAVTVADSDFHSFTNGTNDLPYSISLKATFYSLAGVQLLLIKGNNTNREYDIFLQSSKLATRSYSGGTNTIEKRRTNQTALSINQEYHIVGTYNGTSHQLYLNKVEGGTNTTAGTYVRMNNTTAPLWMGNIEGNANGFFNGKMRDVRIYNKVLTQTEIDGLFEI